MLCGHTQAHSLVTTEHSCSCFGFGHIRAHLGIFGIFKFVCGMTQLAQSWTLDSNIAVLLSLIPLYYFDTDFDFQGCVTFFLENLLKKYAYFTILGPFSAKKTI